MCKDLSVLIEKDDSTAGLPLVYLGKVVPRLPPRSCGDDNNSDGCHLSNLAVVMTGPTPLELIRRKTISS